MPTEISDLWRFELCRGASLDPAAGACLLDAISWLEYGTLGDHPRCVCPVIASYGRLLNDALPDDVRQELRRFIPRMVGTSAQRSVDRRGAWLRRYLATRMVPVLAQGLFPERAARLRMLRPTASESAIARMMTGLLREAERAAQTFLAGRTASRLGSARDRGRFIHGERMHDNLRTACAHWLTIHRVGGWVTGDVMKLVVHGVAARAALLYPKNDPGNLAIRREAYDVAIAGLEGMLRIGRRGDIPDLVVARRQVAKFAEASGKAQPVREMVPA